MFLEVHGGDSSLADTKLKKPYFTSSTLVVGNVTIRYLDLIKMLKWEIRSYGWGDMGNMSCTKVEKEDKVIAALLEIQIFFIWTDLKRKMDFVD
nr:hypothetical protein [Bacteroidota bacterium]